VADPTAWLEEVNDLLVAHDKDMTDVATLKILIHQAQRLVSDAVAREEYMERAKYLDWQMQMANYTSALVQPDLATPRISGFPVRNRSGRRRK
jgi:hypothetical protein